MRHVSSNYRILPVYTDIKDQLRFRCGSECSEVYEVIDTAYPPFQLSSKVDFGNIETIYVKLVCNNGAEYFYNWFGSGTRTQKDIDTDGVDEWIYTFDGGSFESTPAGQYYVEVTFDSGLVLYSEVFSHPGDCQNCDRYWYLEFSHSCAEKSLGDYSMGFKNKLKLGDAIMLPDGELENSILRKDGFGVDTRIATDLRPKWSFEIMGNSWLNQSLRTLHLFNQVYLKRSGGDESFELDNIEVTSRGDALNDCQFPIKISFTKDVLVNTKCCNSVYEQAPLPGNCEGMQVVLSDDFSICSGETTELSASVIGGAAPYVYIWSNGDTGQTIEVTPSESMTLICTIVDAFGCVKQDEIEITLVECAGELEATITPDPDGIICSGDSVDLDLEVTGGSGSYSYEWSTGETTQDITVAPTSTSIYSVTITDTVTMDVTVKTITIVVQPPLGITIVQSGCQMQSIYDPCVGDTPIFSWQIETEPDTWEAAPGSSSHSFYNGVHGSTYRLVITCNGCQSISDPYTLNCPTPCSVEIDSVTYDSEAEELSVQYSGTLGSNPFVTGYISIYEATVPNLEDCDSSTYTFLISVTLTSESDTIVIPYVPIVFPTCLFISVSINASECIDEGHYALT